MNTTATENFVIDRFAAAELLAGRDGRRTLLTDISWNDYENFLEDFESRPGWRLAFDKGRLEIESASFLKANLSVSFHNFIRAYCDLFDLRMEGRRAATFRSRILKKGVEPDECFYIQSAEKIIGKTFISISFPVPDIAVEIDITTESLDKFPIYAALGVQELWIFDGKKLAFYELADKNYHQIQNSRALPEISAEDLVKFLEISRSKGQTAALKSFRQWLGKKSK